MPGWPPIAEGWPLTSLHPLCFSGIEIPCVQSPSNWFDGLKVLAVSHFMTLYKQGFWSPKPLIRTTNPNHWRATYSHRWQFSKEKNKQESRSNSFEQIGRGIPHIHHHLGVNPVMWGPYNSPRLDSRENPKRSTAMFGGRRLGQNHPKVAGVVLTST